MLCVSTGSILEKFITATKIRGRVEISRVILLYVAACKAASGNPGDAFLPEVAKAGDAVLLQPAACNPASGDPRGLLYARGGRGQ